MKDSIHPAYNEITVSCGSCGSTFQIGSTMKNDLRVEICARCHPLYTGKAKLIDTTGRVDRFQARQQKAQGFRDVSNEKLEEVAHGADTESK